MDEHEDDSARTFIPCTTGKNETPLALPDSYTLDHDKVVAKIESRLKGLPEGNSCALFLVSVENPNGPSVPIDAHAKERAFTSLATCFRVSDVVGSYAPSLFAAFTSGRLSERSVWRKCNLVSRALKSASRMNPPDLLYHIGAYYFDGQATSFDIAFERATFALSKSRLNEDSHYFVYAPVAQPDKIPGLVPDSLPWKTLLDNMNDGVRILKLSDGIRPLYANASFNRMLNAHFDPDKPNATHMHPSSLLEYERAVQSVSETGKPSECTCLLSAGSEWVRCEVKITQLMKYPDGTLILLETSCNADDLEAQEDLLGQRDTWLSMMIERSDDLLWVVDLHQRTLHMMSFYENAETRFYDFDNFPKSFISRGHVHPISIAAFKEFSDGLLSGKLEGSGNFYLKRRDSDDYCWSSLSYRMLYDENGRPTKAVGTREDHARSPEECESLEAKRPIPETTLPHLLGYFQANLDTGRVESLRLEGAAQTWASRKGTYEDIVSLTLDSLFVPEEHASFADHFDRETLLRQYREGCRWLAHRYRAIDHAGIVRQVLVSTNLTKNERDETRLAVYLSDVEDRHRWESALNTTPKRDPATNLYDRETTRALIDVIFAECSKDDLCGVALLNIDSLRSSGSSLDEKTVRDLSAALTIFLDTDCIVGVHESRTALAFFPRVSSRKALHTRVERAIEHARSSLEDQTKLEGFRQVARIACAKTGTTTIDDLIKAANDISAGTKAGGDAVVSVIVPNAAESEPTSSDRMADEHESALEEGSSALSDEEKNAAIECLASMLKAESLNESVRNALRCIGMYYHADRLYILSLTNNAKTLAITSEWYAEGKQSIQQSISSKRLDRFPLIKQHVETTTPLLVSRSGSLPFGTPPISDSSWKLALFPILQTSAYRRILCMENPRAHLSRTGIMNKILPMIRDEWTRFDKSSQTSPSFVEKYAKLPDYETSARTTRSLNSERYHSLGALTLDMPHLTNATAQCGFSYGMKFAARVHEVLQDAFNAEPLFRSKDTEFVLLSPNTTYETFIERCALVRTMLRKSYSGQFRIGCTWSDGVFSAKDLVKEARMLMSKDDSCEAFSGVFVDNAFEHEGSYTPAFNEAIEAGKRFIAFLQPKVDTSVGTIVGAELLARMIDEEGRPYAPTDEIDRMEQDGSIYQLDYFMLENALSLLDRWRLDSLPDLPLSVNFSRSTLLRTSAVASVLAIKSRYPSVPSSLIELEVTESAFNVEKNTLERVIDQFRTLGFKISLDDFGSHYSNISVLANIKFDSVKLDRSMVVDIASNDVSKMLVRNIVQICETCDTTCIAEGVETRVQANALSAEGCHVCQGFLYEKPMPSSDFEKKRLARFDIVECTA